MNRSSGRSRWRTDKAVYVACALARDIAARDCLAWASHSTTRGHRGVYIRTHDCARLCLSSYSIITKGNSDEYENQAVDRVGISIVFRGRVCRRGQNRCDGSDDRQHAAQLHTGERYQRGLYGNLYRLLDVKLDLNGFTISGGSLDGITILAKHMNIEVTNGAVTRFSRHGVFVPGAPAESRNIKISRLRVSENKIDGIAMEGNPGFIIEDCLISHNGGTGIYAFSSGLALNSVINSNDMGLFGAALGTGKLGYRSNAFFNNSTNVSGGTNLGHNLCSGAICP